MFFHLQGLFFFVHIRSKPNSNCSMMGKKIFCQSVVPVVGDPTIALCSTNIQTLTLYSPLWTKRWFVSVYQSRFREARRGSEVSGSGAQRRAGRSCSLWWSVEITPWPSLSGGDELYSYWWTGVRLQLLHVQILQLHVRDSDIVI